MRSPSPPLRLTWTSMVRRRANQLRGLDRNIISITVGMSTGHCVMGRYAKRMKFTFNEFCSGYRPFEEEKTIIYFLCQRPFVARCRYRLFGSPILVSITELSSIDVKNIASSFRVGFPAWGSSALNVQTLRWPISSFLFCRDYIHLWRHNGPAMPY